MFDRPTLGLDEALAGMREALAQAREKHESIVICVVDHRGDSVCSAVDDGVIEVSRILAPRKAYTAAIGRSDIATYREKVRASTGISLEALLGPRAISAQGGLPIKRSDDGVVLGGVGVSGASPAARDEELARIAIETMGYTSS